MSKLPNKLPDIKILDEVDKRLRKKSVDVKFPLPEEDKKRIQDMMDYLEMSQIPDLCEKYNLRAGMGLSYIQVGINKRIFVIVYEVEEQKFDRYIIINPKIKSMSEEKIYVAEGEGCLSINRPTVGIVPRNARVTIEYQDIDGNPQTIRVREELAICFQHEIDHLNGILFVDRIDPKNPYKGKDIYRAI